MQKGEDEIIVTALRAIRALRRKDEGFDSLLKLTQISLQESLKTDGGNPILKALFNLYSDEELLTMPPWQRMQRARRHLDGLFLPKEVWKELQPTPEEKEAHFYEIFQDIETSSKSIKEVNWLWESYIPFSQVSLIAGQAGAGKTSLLVELSKAVAKGDLFLQKFPVESGGVIFADLEDGRVSLKLKKVGLSKEDPLRYLDLSQEPQKLRLDAIKWAVGNFEMLVGVPLRLVVVDPLRGFGVEEKDPTKLRPLFDELRGLARGKGCSLVVTHHLRKLRGLMNLDEIKERISGSTDLTAIPASVFGVAHDIELQQASLIPVKSRYGDLPRTLEWTYDEEGCRFSGYPKEEELSIEKAGKFLRRLLQDGPVPSRRVYLEASANGISKMTLRRAQWALRIKPHREEGIWIWELPNDEDIPM